MLDVVYINTPLGITKIAGDANGIQEITTHHTETKVTTTIPITLQQCVSELQHYFNGALQSFCFKTNPQGTPFQQKVWQYLLEIPYGTTTTYAKLSETIGDIKAIRAVANANGKNPLWIVIPCHRVIGTDGSLTGYAGGLWRKKWLLEHEGAIEQLSLF